MFFKTFIKNIKHVFSSMPVTVDGNTVDPVEEFIIILGQHTVDSQQLRTGIGLHPAHWTCSQRNGETGLCLESEQAQYFHEAPYILDVCVTSTTLWSRDLDPHTSRLEKNWIPSIYVAKDASCTSAGTSSCPTMKFCIVPACSTSHTSSINEDWVSLVMSPDFEATFRQTRSSESVS